MLKTTRNPKALVKFAVRKGWNEGNLGFCEDTNNKENTNNQDFNSEN